jgi:predicted esterase
VRPGSLLATSLAVALAGGAPALAAGSKEKKVAVALFEGRIEPAEAAKAWKKKRLSPDDAVAMLEELLPYRKGKRRDHVTTLRDRRGRSTDARVGMPSSGPDEQGRYGIAIILHGLGGSSDQVFQLGKALAPPHTIVIAPNAQKPGADAPPYEDLRTANMVKLPIMDRFPHWWSYQPDAFPLQAVDYLQQRYPIDTDRILLVGYSMGGFGTWNIGLRYHDRFAGLMPMAGGISREEFLLGKDTFCRGLLDNARTVPTFFAHGDSDSVVPVKFDRWTAEGLKDRGFPFTYEEVPGGKHVLDGLMRGALQEKVIAWLAERRRDPNPSVVEHRALRPYHPGAYWVRLDGFKAPSAKVLATCHEGENRVEVTSEGAAKVTVYLDPAQVETDERVTITLNGKEAHAGKVKPSLLTVAETFARSRDPKLVYARGVTLKVK